MDAKRSYDLDWLRVLAILSVFVYHSTRFFNFGDWHVKNPFMYAWVEALEGFMEIWMMPLVFLISGASIFYAMNKGGAGKFFKDKILRLLIRLLVVVFTHASCRSTSNASRMVSSAARTLRFCRITSRAIYPPMYCL